MTLLKLNNQNMFHINLIFVILSTMFVNLATAEFYQDCGSPAGVITDVEVDECKPTDKVCILKKNTNATITIKFKTNQPTESVTADVHGIVAGRSIAFPLANSNGCFKSGLLCPLAEGVENTYENTLAILKVYPSLSVKVKWELKNEKGEDLACVLIAAKIKT
ncbi:ecdysteroid-regulated 16 kDa protein-like [Chrysoperla carnea]|uniref:ecdysteroid-regulated 16 kDa protein-like n=1 Tax=Chrysoperla carnea TaxID=189513 RepID=UPI001D0878E0|nr:ecdysteroid-regulated 16 kDa protein-like [Chrysoperla carnea]